MIALEPLSEGRSVEHGTGGASQDRWWSRARQWRGRSARRLPASVIYVVQGHLKVIDMHLPRVPAIQASEVVQHRGIRVQP